MTRPNDPRDARPLTSAQHHAFVIRRFAAAAPGLVTVAWTRGLMTLHAPLPTSPDFKTQRSIHRASCPVIAAAAAIPENHLPGPIWPVTSILDAVTDLERCPDCGTTSLPDGALLADDTPETVAARQHRFRTDQRLAAYQVHRTQILKTAREQATAQVLAAQAPLVDALTARRAQQALADLAHQFPDVAFDAVLLPPSSDDQQEAGPAPQ